MIRRGGGRARGRLARELAPDAVEMAALAVAAETSTEVARQALLEAMADPADPRAALAAAVARRCDTDERREAFAAYLHLHQGWSVEDVAVMFGTDPASAARLVDAGAGAAVASGKHCRGWPLVDVRRATAAERSAAEGHLGLCRPCRRRRDAQQAIRRRVAAATGSVTVGTAAAGLVARLLAAPGGIFSGALPGAALPIAGLGAVAVLTTAVGGAVAALHHHHHDGGTATHRPASSGTRPDGSVSGPGAEPAASTDTGGPSSGPDSPGGSNTSPTPSPTSLLPTDLLPSSGLPTLSTTLVPLPTTTDPLSLLSASPLPTLSTSLTPLPTTLSTTLPPLPLPTTSTSLPLPLTTTAIPLP